MAETKRKAGRPKKEQSEPTVDVKVENNSNDELIKQLMEQVANLTKQVEDAKKQADSANNEKSDLQQLVDALQANQRPIDKLPTKVKVISLLENQLNLSTQPSGQGKVYSFAKLGDAKIIRMQDLEEILSIAQYRDQAEKGYYYICNADVIEEFGLTEEYEHIFNDKVLADVETLKSDNAVDIFVGLNKTVQDSLARKMAENIANGARLDRNKLEDIRLATDIDIEKMANDFKEFKEKNKGE